MQSNPQLPTTPPLKGSDAVDAINDALKTIGTNFSGDIDPAALAWPYATWADTGNMLLKRRNAANTAWVTICPLLEELATKSSASEASAGIIKIATQAEVGAGVDDEKAVTPKKLRAGFSINLAGNGHIAFPTWMGGLIINWGAATTSGGGGTRLTFSTAFPSSGFAFTTGSLSGLPAGYIATGNLGLGFVDLYAANLAGAPVSGLTIYCIAIGR